VYAETYGREADFLCFDCAETNGNWQDGRWRKARVVEAAEAAVKVEATGGGGGGEGDADEPEWIAREEWPRRLFNR
jgi:hypothetical protein